MAQAYCPPSARAGPTVKESVLPGLDSEKQFKVEDVQEAYVEHRGRLVNAIDSTKSILGELRQFNKEEWIVRYPQLREQDHTSSAAAESSSKRPSSRHSLSFADDPTAETNVDLKPGPPGMPRSFSLASVRDVSSSEEKTESLETSGSILAPEVPNFQVLRLDLKLGTHGSSTSATSLVSQLEKSSIANLLDERLASAINHIEKLRLRVEDTSSKVLVTGDLNAGKSTFVNALLRREVMPVDQQPCTTAFCEVHDAAENDDVEEVHLVRDGVVYSIGDESTFTRSKLSDLEQIVADNDNQRILKVYLADTRAPSESLLNNGVVDISLIDAPGLNRDSLKTTAVFARQEEIDVVVFVVSAENHFTLSAKEFLWNASNEKAYLFIVVNKFEQIKNKEKCKRLVLEQIRQLSPGTYEDAEDLVHFVDSASALQPFTANPAFDDLESSLRSFVLVKRSKSKLQPVSTYLSNLLCDIDFLAGANAIVAQKELNRAKDDLNRVRPVLEKMKSSQDTFEEGLEVVEEEGANKSIAVTRDLLSGALERVGQGQLGANHHSLTLPSYPGLLGVWDYVRDVRKVLLQSLDVAVRLAEDEARKTTTAGVNKVSQLGDEHLPKGTERSRRVFMPEAMFSAHHTKRNLKGNRMSSGGVVVAGGMHGLGIGLAQRSDLVEPSFTDIFDLSHQFSVHFGDKFSHAEDDERSMTALSVVSIGVGALTMVGGNAFGARGLIEGIVRVVDLLGNETTRKWAAPVLGAVTIGLTAYFVFELPNTIPRTVGRRIKLSLVKLEEGATEDELFVNAHVGRVGRETRKVLRLASWDLRERFRAAMDERNREVKGAEELETKAKGALEFFEGVQEKSGQVREGALIVSP